MSTLIIGLEEHERIAEVMAYAKANPVPLSLIQKGILDDTTLLQLKDRKPGFERPPAAGVTFRGGYRAVFSIEEQPAGLYTHLSISVEDRPRKGKLPNVEAVKMICKEFGVSFPPDHGWNEEYEPGKYAVNLLSPLKGMD